MFEVKVKVTGYIDFNDRAQVAIREEDMAKEYCELFEIGDEGIITWDCKDLVENLQKELAEALAVVTRYVDATNNQVD
jgi:hypothetical protein